MYALLHKNNLWDSFSLISLAVLFHQIVPWVLSYHACLINKLKATFLFFFQEQFCFDFGLGYLAYCLGFSAVTTIVLFTEAFHKYRLREEGRDKGRERGKRRVGPCKQTHLKYPPELRSKPNDCRSVSPFSISFTTFESSLNFLIL